MDGRSADLRRARLAAREPDGGKRAVMVKAELQIGLRTSLEITSAGVPMALRPCRECGASISTDAKSCPQCGKQHPPNWRSAIAPLPMENIMISARRSVLAVALLGCGTNASPPVTPPQVTTVFEQQWVLFSDPRTDTLLGVGYNLGNQYSTGCYAIGNLRASAGSDTMRLAWNRTSGDTVSVKLADILGFGHQARRAIRGSILLTGLRQLYADDVAPTRIGCRAKGKDGLPLNPAVVALVGATGYSFSLYDERGRSLNGDIDQAGLKGNAVRAQGDTTAVSFGTLRWLGLRLNGYELDGPVGAMVTTGPFSFREPYNIGNNLQVRVEPLGDDRFAVQHGFQGLGSAFGLDTVTAHETFLLGSPGAVPTRGYIYPAAIVPHNQSHYRLNRGEPRRLLVREFARNSDVDSLRNWIAGR